MADVDPQLVPMPAVGADVEVVADVDPQLVPMPAVGADAQPFTSLIISFPQGHTNEGLDAAFSYEAMFHHGPDVRQIELWYGPNACLRRIHCAQHLLKKVSVRCGEVACTCWAFAPW